MLGAFPAHDVTVLAVPGDLVLLAGQTVLSGNLDTLPTGTGPAGVERDERSESGMDARGVIGLGLRGHTGRRLGLTADAENAAHGENDDVRRLVALVGSAQAETGDRRMDKVGVAGEQRRLAQA